MNEPNINGMQALLNAKAAISAGDKFLARKWASQAVKLDPSQEEAWLILAALGSPQESIAYYSMAKRINPESDRVKEGLQWAFNRLNLEEEKKEEGKSTTNRDIENSIPNQYSKKNKAASKKNIGRLIGFPIVFIMTVLGINLMIWGLIPSKWVVLADNYSSNRREAIFIKPTLTPTSTFTALPTATASRIPTQTNTVPLTDIPDGTSTPTVQETSAPMFLPGLPQIPYQVDPDEKWIDVNMSNQTIYALEGPRVINSFRVSTGKSDTPTVGGIFYIYQKLLASPMSGDDYYYPEIPYVMYFYQGYGFHGVTWPLKLGVPTSHGCVNMITSDAEWLYNWADVGTLINVHF